MPLAATLFDRARAPAGRKAIKYALVSAVSVAVAQISLFVLFGVLHWTARSANILAAAIAGVPSYYLNRTWVWGRTGRSHVWREVVPFWAIAFLGLAFSTVAADVGESVAMNLFDTRRMQALVVNAFSLAAYGVLWVGKFIVFNKVLFVHRGDEDVRAP